MGRTDIMDASATSRCISLSSRSCSDKHQLEELAEAFQKELLEHKLVLDQHTMMKTIPKAFKGKDAVNVLQKLMHSRSDKSATITRERALEKGNEIMDHYTFFKHASSDKPLLDTSMDLYQFDHNLPCQVQVVKNQHKSHWDKVRLLEQHIDCKDRRHMFRTYPSCFVAKEAVDVMMDLKLVKSRKEAVHLMNHLNKKVFCCEHVTQEHQFKDEYLYFYFIPHNERMPDPSPKLAAKKVTEEGTISKRNLKADASAQNVTSVPAESSIDMATRRSIKKNFPLGAIMSKGNNNPITLHSVNEDVFVRIWSLIAETMVVTGELGRPTKEAIAHMVSERNNCPVCATAHCMMEAAATHSAEPQTKDVDRKRHEQALEYAGLVFDAMTHKQSESIRELCPVAKNSKRFSRLNDMAKAECALVVVLFSHMNRVASAILGKEMSTAMFGVPRAAARVMESKGMIQVINKMMAPLLPSAFQGKQEAGMSMTLFPEESRRKVPLPNHLQRVLLAGLERSQALGRLQHWVADFEKHNRKVMTKDLIQFLEDPRTTPPKSSIEFGQTDRVQDWAERCLPDLMEAWGGDLDNDPKRQAIAWVFVLTTFAPQTVYQSTYWYTLVDYLGEEMARLLVIWWSLRHTLKTAKGLNCDEMDVNAVMKQVLKQ